MGVVVLVLARPPTHDGGRRQNDRRLEYPHAVKLACYLRIVSDPVRQVPPGFDALTVDEQVDYVQYLWERIAPRVDQHPVPAEHNAVLDRRLAELEANPDAFAPAADVVGRLRAGLRQS